MNIDPDKFAEKENIIQRKLDLCLVSWSFYFPHGKVYMQFEGMTYQQTVDTPMGTNCDPL